MHPRSKFSVSILPDIVRKNGSISAHEVRRMRPCAHCEGVGFNTAMVLIDRGMTGVPGAFYHPQCYLSAFGFRAVTKLPLKERDKYRLCDVNARQMRRLLDIR